MGIVNIITISKENFDFGNVGPEDVWRSELPLADQTDKESTHGLR
jgi:hypothetical protein